MPWSIKENDDRCPASKPWSVVNQDTNDLRGCHPSKESARQQQKALYANVPDSDRANDPDDEADDEHTPQRGEYPPAPVLFTKPKSVAW